jgi:hypothetical protein
MLRNVSLPAKLFIAPLTIIIATVILGFMSYLTIQDQENGIIFLYTSSLAKKEKIGQVKIQGRDHAVRVHNLSEGGAFLSDVPKPAAGTIGVLRLPELAFELPFSVVNGPDGALCLRFNLPDDHRQAYIQFLKRVAADNNDDGPSAVPEHS